MTTITKQTTTIQGEAMKELKNMIKGFKRRSIPVLETIKIEPTEKEYNIKVTYTDSDIYAERTFEVIESTINKPFLLPITYIKGLKGIKNNDSFTFEPGEQFVVDVTTKGIVQKVYSIDHEEFPVNWFNNEEFTSVGNLFQDDLSKLKDASISVSKSDTRPVLTYALIRNNSIISTDSHRLYKTSTNLTNDNDILINKDFITYLAANEKKDFSSTISISDNYIKIETHNAKYYQRQYQGNFPDVSRLIPNDFSLQFEILDYDKFKDTLESVKSLKLNNHVVKLETTNNSIILSCDIPEAPEAGKIESEIKVNYINYTDTKIHFSSAYMLEGLKQIGSKNVQIDIVSNMRPFLVHETNNNDTFSLILPVRTY